MKDVSLERASRPQTLTGYLSSVTWKQGPTAFFSHGVPFSYGVGPTLARRIWAAYRSVYTHSHVKGLEIGAGLGYLSKQCLEIAGSDISQWHVSDASSVLVDHWKSAQTFSQYPQATLGIQTLALPFVSPARVDLIVMSYIVDSTPTCHLEWDNGRLYEWVITTQISDMPVAVMTEGDPPVMTLPAQTLWAQWDAYAETDIPWLAPRLSRACHETWHRIPVQESRCLSSADRAFLTSFWKDMGCPNMRLNYPLMLRTRLPELMATLSPHGMIALHDFGYQATAGAAMTEDLCTSFGTIQAYPLCFPLIAWLAKSAGLFFQISEAPEGESALCLLSKQPLPETWWAEDALHIQAHSLQTRLQDMAQYPEKHMDTAIPAYGDYALMAHRAAYAMTTTDKVFWLQKALSDYPDLAIPSYAQYAEILVEKGDSVAALAMILEAVSRFPLDPTLALSLGNLYVREKQFPEALSVFQGSIRRLDAPLVWQVLKLMALLRC